MQWIDLDPDDQELIDAAIDVLRRNYREERHEVGAAVRCSSGKIYAGVNVESCGYGPCAEPIALGTAISQGEREFLTIVAVGRHDDRYPLLSPCGNCRQMLFDYAPDVFVVLEHNGSRVKAKVSHLLPAAYTHFD